MSNIAFRVSNSDVSGRGHLSRCLAIRKYLTGSIIWFVDQSIIDNEIAFNKKDKFIIEDFPQSINTLKKFILTKRIKLVIVDSYLIDIQKLEYISNKVPTISICDFFPYPKVDLILNHQPNAKVSKNVLAGPTYAPILYSDSSIKKNKIKLINKKIYKKKQNDINLLISFGTFDSKGITKLVLKTLLDSDVLLSKISITVLMGKNSPHLKDVYDLSVNRKNIKVLVEPNNLVEIYHSTDLAIGAPGSSHFERLFFGIPTVLVPQNDGHKILVESWVFYGVSLGAESNSKSILKNVIFLIENPSECIKLSSLGKKIVDGKGAERVSKEIKGIV